MLCIGSGSTVNQTNRMKFENDQFYMKTEEEMREALKDFTEACDNTVEVAAKCDVTLERGATSCRSSPCPRARPRSRGSWRVQEDLGFTAPGARARAEAGRLRDGHHHPAGLPGLLPHRAGVHRMGAQPGHRRGPGPRLGCPATIVAYAMGISPTLTPCPTASCSSDSSRPSAWRCPISTSTFEQGRREEASSTHQGRLREDHVSQVITFRHAAGQNAVRDSARVLDYLAWVTIPTR